MASWLQPERDLWLLHHHDISIIHGILVHHMPKVGALQLDGSGGHPNGRMV
jgi:hypothetical protein